MKFQLILIAQILSTFSGGIVLLPEGAHEDRHNPRQDFFGEQLFVFSSRKKFGSKLSFGIFLHNNYISG